MNYQKMTIDDIIGWCEENNQVEWLQRIAAKTTKVKRHTGRIKVYDEAKQKYIYKADKTSPVVVKEQPISFMEIKTAFVDKFMPEIKPEKKEKYPTMFDRIKKLKAEAEAGK